MLIGYPELRCREIALSWIPAPYAYSYEERVEYFETVFENYIDYHENRDGILDSFPYRNLHINWDDNYGYGTLGGPSEGYELDSVIVLNSDSIGVAAELRKKAYLWTYNLHGGANENSFGYNPLGQTGKKDALWTTPEEFDIYFQFHGTPALLVHPLAACQYAIVDTGGPGKCCWPQRMLEAGVWAYYGLHGNGSLTREMETAFMESPFLGHAVRRLPVGSALISGDITARFLNSDSSRSEGIATKEKDDRFRIVVNGAFLSVQGREGDLFSFRRLVNARGSFTNIQYDSSPSGNLYLAVDHLPVGLYFAELELDGVRVVEPFTITH